MFYRAIHGNISVKIHIEESMMEAPPEAVAQQTRNAAGEPDAAHKQQLETKPPKFSAPLVHLFDTYLLGKKLGGGSFGTVKAAVHVKTGKRVAIKIINRECMQQESGAEDKVRREIHILRLLQNPHIVRLYEVIQTPNDIYLVMEYVASGELFELLNERGRLTEVDACRFFQQLLLGVEACHDAGIVHRDLKPENLLLTTRGTHGVSLKIADFGLSNILREGHFLKTSCGSPNYAAPEVITGKLYAGPEVDVWSSGCILYALLCGRLPFDDANVGSLFRAIKAGQFELPLHLSLKARDLLKRMLTVDPLSRITIAEIREHQWFSLHVPIPFIRHSGRQEAINASQSPSLPQTAVLEALKSLGYNPQAAAIDVFFGRQTPAAVAYHLLADDDVAQSRVDFLGSSSTIAASDGRMHMSSWDTFDGKSAPGSFRATAYRRGSWQAGLPLRPPGGPHTIIAAVVTALAAEGCRWKPLTLFSYRCRSPDLSRQVAHAKEPPEGDTPEQGGVKFEIQLYSIGGRAYIVDVMRLQGGLACFLDVCYCILTRVIALTTAATLATVSSVSAVPIVAAMVPGTSNGPVHRMKAEIDMAKPHRVIQPAWAPSDDVDAASGDSMTDVSVTDDSLPTRKG